MKIHLKPVDFMNSGGYFIPKDEELFKAVQAYCREQLNQPRDLWLYSKLWAVFKDEEIVGVVGFQQKVDVSLYRVSDGSVPAKVHRKIFDRIGGFLADSGLLGQEVLVHVGNEPEHERCPGREAALEAYGAVPANRYSVTIR